MEFNKYYLCKIIMSLKVSKIEWLIGIAYNLEEVSVLKFLYYLGGW